MKCLHCDPPNRQFCATGKTLYTVWQRAGHAYGNACYSGPGGTSTSYCGDTWYALAVASKRYRRHVYGEEKA